jgi:ATP-dependent exoDNAse (exonuclease V) beta subunit
METLCGNDDAAGGIGFAIGKRTLDEALSDESFTEIVRRAMRKNAIGNQMVDGDSTERTLMRMVWNALNTALTIGGRTFFLKDIPPADRRAEIGFVLDEKVVLGADLPPLGGRPRDGVFNGSIDLLVRPDGAGGRVYIVDWKTNTLDDYDEKSVTAAMEAAGYPLQFRLYSLAASRWLGEDALAGVAYLFVRGGECRDGRSGVYAHAADAAFMADCRTAVRAALPNSTTTGK